MTKLPVMDSHHDIERLLHESRERLKELNAINKTTAIIRENKSIDETLHNICLILPNAMQYPEHAVSRIRYMDSEYKSHLFHETKWKLSKSFKTIDNFQCVIEVFYTREFPEAHNGSFLKEEEDLLSNLSSIILGYINSQKAKQVFTKVREEDLKVQDISAGADGKDNMFLLQKYWAKLNYSRDVFHDLMPFKVREILLISTLYDAYSLEKEGRIAEHVLGEYQQLNLSSLPRITAVSAPTEVFDKLTSKHYDLIIYMIGNDTKTPKMLCKEIKSEYPYIPIFFLLNSNISDEFNPAENEIPCFDKMFVWNGLPNLFFAMVKHLEDMVNVDNDTRIGLVRVILVVEDEPGYFSRYLPLLYNIVLEQTRDIIEDVSTDELYKVLKLRGRPKILHVTSFEEAMDLYIKYREFMLCVISDVKFFRNGELDESAGFDLVAKVREDNPEMPVIIQSSEIHNAARAYELKTTFIDKNSETLSADIMSFIRHYLGFGHFVYRSPDGREIAVARSLKEFEAHLRNIPDDSLMYHARRNHFSLWLMARGEIHVAKILGPKKVSDFKSPEEIRDYLLKIIKTHRNEQDKGKILPFDEIEQLEEGNILSLSGGSVGGKGRGLAFINTLLYAFDLSKVIPNINLRTPKTCFIGTDEFDFFIERNQLLEAVMYETDYEVIKRTFLNAPLSEGLVKKLKRLLKLINKPIAVRSSGLFEDSIRQPFAGIFETYLISNSSPSFEARLKQLTDAVKLVFASVFSPVARGYIQAVNYKIEQEKMAVVIQEVVGNKFGDYFYPHISGVAQSYNYYPFAHMRPEEGFAVLALGLGKYVVEGDKAYRFSPKYPTTEILNSKDLYKNSQVDFLALDLNKHDFDLLEGEMASLAKLDIFEAETQGNLRHLASVYDIDSGTLVPGITKDGPRVINFSNILKYNYIPLAKTIEMLLQIVEEAMGAPVEIEFAVDINRDKNLKASFYLLQIKPLLGSNEDYEINTDELKKEDLLLYAEKSMGNGKVENICDVIYIKKDIFDKTQTMSMAEEIDLLNKKMTEQNIKYILIGPGRWGSRDRFIGIPVNWPQISNAKLIVETSLEEFPLDASMGSHFFHNVTSMNVGYCSIQHTAFRSFIAWELLDKQEVIEETKWFRHIRFQKSVSVRMDGKKRITVVSLD
jgi:hypothetical protein